MLSSKILSNIALISALIGLPACESEEVTRAPALGAMGGTTLAGVSGGSSSNAGGASAVKPGEGDLTVSGELRVFGDDQFGANSSAYLKSVDVFVLDEDGRSLVDGFGADGQFSVEGVVKQDGGWIFVAPSEDAATMMTVTQHNIGAGSVDVTLVRAALLDGILSNLTSAPAVSSVSSQLLMKFVDPLGASVSGVNVIVSGGPDLAYASGAAWLESRNDTDIEGLALAYNIPVKSSPGEDRLVILSGAVAEELTVRLVAGAVTVVTVTVQ